MRHKTFVTVHGKRTYPQVPRRFFTMNPDVKPGRKRSMKIMKEKREKNKRVKSKRKDF
jgi:hypothetical protein